MVTLDLELKLQVRVFMETKGYNIAAIPIGSIIVHENVWQDLCEPIQNLERSYLAAQAKTQTPPPDLTKYKVIFTYVQINDHHDTFAGTGEWKLSGAINDQIYQLDSCDRGNRENDPGTCVMDNVKDGQMINLNIGRTIEVGQGGVLYLRVGGLELDGESWKPFTIPEEFKWPLKAASSGVGAATEIPLMSEVLPLAVDYLDDAIKFGGEIVGAIDSNDVLGTVSVDIPFPIREGNFYKTSSTGDYTIGYSITKV